MRVISTDEYVKVQLCCMLKTLNRLNVSTAKDMSQKQFPFWLLSLMRKTLKKKKYFHSYLQMLSDPDLHSTGTVIKHDFIFDINKMCVHMQTKHKKKKGHRATLFLL